MSWDYIKELMVRAYCGRKKCVEEEMRYRYMIVAIMRDSYNGRGYTIFISLHGTPPKAYAVLQAIDDFDPERDDEVTIGYVRVYGLEFKHYTTLAGLYRVSLGELRRRSDVKLAITSGVYTQELLGKP